MARSDQAQSPRARLVGAPASPGAASGPAFVYRAEGTRPAPAPRRGERADAAGETARFAAALEQTRAELDALIAGVDQKAADIFRAHLLMLSDPMLVDGVNERIRDRACPAEEALALTVAELAAMLRGLDDEYLRGRAVDVEDVGWRLRRHLGAESGPEFPPGAVVVARDLTPSEVLAAVRAGAVAAALEEGAANSHAAILARGLRLPVVVGVKGLLAATANGTDLLVDGTAGEVVVAPPAGAARRAAAARREIVPAAHAFPEARTADGRRVPLYANIGRPEELAVALAAGAEGVGLLRTEFMFLEFAPSEDYQYELCRQMVAQLAGRPLVVRTLDAGGDKPLAYTGLAPEANPFLGLRGLRLSLARPEPFITQLRAILRAAAHGPVRPMYPMVTNAAELVQARALLARARADLAREGFAVPETVEAGAMVEVPAAAICADDLAKEAAFLSIGTNDLAQYTLAADRGNPAVAAIYDQLHPAVLRLLRATVEGARRWGRPVAVCGTLASDPAAVPILVGLGVDELSVSPDALEPVRRALAATSYAEAKALVAKRLAPA